MGRPALKAAFILEQHDLTAAEIVKLGAKRGVPLSPAYVAKILQRERQSATKQARAAARANGHAPKANGHAPAAAPAATDAASADANLRAEFLRFMMRVGTERAQEWLQAWRETIN
jgi:hypothetical protein